jgi:hypothetical protein
LGHLTVAEHSPAVKCRYCSVTLPAACYNASFGQEPRYVTAKTVCIWRGSNKTSFAGGVML